MFFLSVFFIYFFLSFFLSCSSLPSRAGYTFDTLRKPPPPPTPPTNYGLTLYFFHVSFFLHSAFFISFSFFLLFSLPRYFLTRVPIVDERIQYKFENRFLLQQADSHPSYKENFWTSAGPIRYRELALDYVLSSVGDPDPGSGAFLTTGSGIGFSGSWILDPGFQTDIFES